MSLTCFRARRLMDGRSAGLGDPDRLRLEDHLAGCGACLQHSRALESVRTLARSAEPSVTESIRRRVIDRAIAQAGSSHEAVSVSTLGQSSWMPALAGVMAITAALVVTLASPRGTEKAVELKPPVIERAQRFISTQPERIVVAGAELALGRSTTVDWNAKLATVFLREGEVNAHVASRSGQIPFRVTTPRFVVVVIGTEFRVAINSVSVLEGVVRIEALDGRVLRAALRAGETWTLESDIPKTVAATSAPSIEAPVADPRDPAIPARQWLATARSRLARGDVNGARFAVTQARVQQLGSADRAEAETLLAECFQVEGDVPQAIEQYTKVADGYRGSGAGDNAAYAAARLALMGHDMALRERLLQSYLRDYPEGRFRDDASQALSKLGRGSVR